MRKAEKENISSLCPTVPSAVKWGPFKWTRAGLAALCLYALACGQGEAPATDETPKEIYDVPPAIEIPIADDPQEPPRPKGLSGRLPAGFPENLPLALPASLIDYAPENEERWVDILSMSDAAESEMLAAAAEAGWQNDGQSLRSGEHVVRLEFRDGNPGTIVRVFF